MSRPWRCGTVAGLLLCLSVFPWLGPCGDAAAETCLSPFVKRLDRPEKYLYVFCVDADAKDNDFLAVIDVDAESPDVRHDHLPARPRLGRQRDAPLRLHRRPHAHLGLQPVLQPHLPHRRGRRPGQAEAGQDASTTSAARPA